VLALSLAAAGCYSYTEVSPAAVPPGSDVRLRVARGSALSVGTRQVPDDGRPLRGKVLPGTSADTLLFSVALGPGEPGNPSLGLRGMVPIPMSDVELVEVRRLEKARTWAFVGVGALLGLVVLDWAFDVTNADKPGSEPGGADNAAIVRFRLRR
jgi:hypothetical protein